MTPARNADGSARTKAITVRLRPDDYAKLRRAAFDAHTTPAELALSFIEIGIEAR